MTRDAEHTPSPQSVVVPVEPTLPLHFDSVRIAAVLRAEAERLGKGVPSDLPGLHKDLWTAAEIIDMAEEATAFAHQMNAMLAAAPAPSSLAGGEWVREDYGNSTLLYTLKQQGWRKGEPIMVNDKTVRVEFDGDREPVIAAILAALSPEAPAREGVKYTIRQEYGFGITEHDPALTPRHEAPASDSEAMQRSMQQILDHDEAPAEGAGEVESIARLMCRQHYGDRGYSTPGILNVVESDWPAWKEKAEEVIALRARSSAPEAREGDCITTQSLNDAASDPEWCAKWNREPPEEWSEGPTMTVTLVRHQVSGTVCIRKWDGGDDFEPGTHVLVPLCLAQRAVRTAVSALHEARRNLIGCGDHFGAGQVADVIAALSTPDALKGDAK